MTQGIKPTIGATNLLVPMSLSNGGIRTQQPLFQFCGTYPSKHYLVPMILNYRYKQNSPAPGPIDVFCIKFRWILQLQNFWQKKSSVILSWKYFMGSGPDRNSLRKKSVDTKGSHEVGIVLEEDQIFSISASLPKITFFSPRFFYSWRFFFTLTTILHSLAWIKMTFFHSSLVYLQLLGPCLSSPRPMFL